MSETKFRLWEKELKAMMTPENSDQFLISLDGRVFDTGFTFSHQAEYCEDMVVMLSTGLKDKNGVEIYEGDIVKFKSRMDSAIGEVVYRQDETHFAFSLPYSEGDGFRPVGHGWYGCEVIGNIYENPKLIK